MQTRILRWCRIIGLGAAATLLLAAAASAQATAPDVGLITQLSGAVTYWNKAEQKEPVPAKAFMKVRQGDNFKMDAAGSLTLLYFGSGRQEIWKGPAAFSAGAAASAAAGDQKPPAQPVVKLISTRAAKQLAGTPLFLPRSSTARSGGIQTMTPAGLAPAGTPAPLTKEAQSQIKEAEGIYQDLLKTAAAHDVTPELYLLSVLAKYGQYAEMDKLVDTMLQKKPGDQALKDLQAWVQSKSGQGLAATPGYGGKKIPRGTPGAEMPTTGQGPDAAAVKELLKKGWADLEEGRGIAALNTYQQALKLSEKALGPEHPLTAASMAHLARLYSRIGIFDRALPLAQKSLQIREKVLGPEHPQTAQSLMILGVLYGQMGDHGKALQMNQKALKISEQALGPDAQLTASALHNLAMLYSQMGAYDQALPLAQRAVQIREKVLGLEDSQTATSLANLGYLYLVKKDYQQAQSCFQRAQHRKGDFGMVELYLATGKYDTALNLLAKNAPKAWNRPQFQALYYTQKGLALKGLERRGDASEAFQEAIKYIEELRARTPGERSSFFEFGLFGGYFRAYKGMVGLLAEMAQKGEPAPAGLQTYGPEPGAAAFFFAESIKARSLLEALAAGAGRVKPELPGDLAAKEKTLQERLQTLESQRVERVMTKTVSGPRSHDRLDQSAQNFQLERDALQGELDRFVTEIRRRDPRYAALAYPQPYKARELPLKPGEVLLEYALGEKEGYLFRVEPGGKTQVFRLAVGQEALEKRLGAMLAPFRKGVVRREDLSRFTVRDAAALYQEILAPALSGVNPGTRLIIVPDGVLGAFPFEALVVQAGPDWGKCTLVGDRWPVTYSQSAAILALNRHLGPSHASQALFALGDPIFDRGGSRYLAYKGGQGKAGELKHAGPEKALTMAATDKGWGRLEFPPLPETRQTVLELAALFQEKPQPPQVLLDVFATETKLRQSHLGQYRYLFFGTHGFLADKMAGVREPTLVLTQVENKVPDNGFLSLSKVMRLKLDANLVTLAACMTGVGQVMQGEGVLNFARAFQQAGSRSVMVSLWNIPVHESMQFYTAFYKALKEGKPKIEALKVARQTVRAKEPHPYFWAGLILHGEG
jgi:CHAT domain-containing protein/tetratricopeptide (TPR) repeat protein